MTLDKGPDGIRYASTRRSPPPLPGVCNVTCRPLSAPSAAVPGTLEHFLAERCPVGDPLAHYAAGVDVEIFALERL